jgi:hypothetical protein
VVATCLRTAKAVLCGIGVALTLGGSTVITGTERFASTPSVSDRARAETLEALRGSGDRRLERRHAWSIIVSLTAPITADHRTEPFFETWHGEDEVFTKSAAERFPRGIAGFSRTNGGTSDTVSQSVGIPIVTYTLYNDPAYQHIRHYRLNEAGELNRLKKNGPADTTVDSDRSIPQFPSDSVILKTAWWPIARDKVTALPVWDSRPNAQGRAGDPYTSWQRVVAVDPFKNESARSMMPIDFAGNTFPHAHQIGLNAFYHVAVSAPMAARMMKDPETRKAILIALGRPLHADDNLVLVAASLATREIPNWIWATFWWHDQPDTGPFAADRPGALKSEWRNYLMQTAFDSEKPAANDGGPDVCFNPWLEGRFPNGGSGNGTVSNCVACHQRASYPPVSFLPVTRGRPDLRNDPAYASGRLRTSFLWSLAMHARP